jgi:pilus assembly protein Flp/PilA
MRADDRLGGEQSPSNVRRNGQARLRNGSPMPFAKYPFAKVYFGCSNASCCATAGVGRATNFKGLAGKGAAIELHIQRHEPLVAPTNRLTTSHDFGVTRLDVCDARTPPADSTGLLLKLRTTHSINLRSLTVVLRSWMSSTQFPIRQRRQVLQRYFLRFLSDQSGATAIEYGLIAAGISLAIIAVVNGLGTNLNGQFTTINTSLK